MDDRLYRHILHALRRAGTVRGVCLMLQNEPLLDRRLGERVRQAKRILGKEVRVTSVTNGAMLTPSRMDRLLDCGLDGLAVSIDAACAETFEKIRRGLDFAKVVRNAETLLRRWPGDRTSVRFLRQRDNEGEEQAFAGYWRSRGARVDFDSMTNRAGLLDDFERMHTPPSGLMSAVANALLNRFFRACPLPFARIGILWDGRVILCCHDWGPRDILGDLSRQSVEAVWNGERINRCRHLLWSRQTGESLVCRDCSLASRFWNAQ